MASKLGLKNKEIFGVWIVGSNYGMCGMGGLLAAAEYKAYPLEYALSADDKPHKMMDEWNSFHKKFGAECECSSKMTCSSFKDFFKSKCKKAHTED